MGDQRTFYKKEYGVSSELLEGVPKYLHKAQKGDENFIKYTRMSARNSCLNTYLLGKPIIFKRITHQYLRNQTPGDLLSLTLLQWH